ncbi:MAG: hypothetical protein R3C14_10355 [Caldilineaceae bacterium]
MTKLTPPRYRSFLLRLWQDPTPEPHPAWRGELVHVQSGRRWFFATLEALLEFLAAQGGQVDDFPP